MRKVILLLCVVATLLSFSGCKKTFTHEVYEISITMKEVYNESVGSDWHREYICNGEAINSGKQWTVPIGSEERKTIDITITEVDKYPDIGYSSLDITLTDGFKATTSVIIVENMGRYKGNEAKLEISCLVKRVKQIGHYSWIDTANENLDKLIYKYPDNIFLKSIKSFLNNSIRSFTMITEDIH